MNKKQKEFWENLTGENVKIITTKLDGTRVPGEVVSVFINNHKDTRWHELENKIREMITDSNGEANFRTTEKIQSIHVQLPNHAMARRQFYKNEPLIVSMLVL